VKKIILLVVAFCMVPMARAAEELDEKMPVDDWTINYKPARDAGHKALAAGNYAEAIAQFDKAADATAFAYVRAIHWGNIGLAYLRNAHKVKSMSDAKDAAAAYQDALDLMDQADARCVNGCIHETDCTSKRKSFRGVFERGIRNAKKLLGL